MLAPAGDEGQQKAFSWGVRCWHLGEHSTVWHSCGPETPNPALFHEQRAEKARMCSSCALTSATPCPLDASSSRALKGPKNKSATYLESEKMDRRKTVLFYLLHRDMFLFPFYRKQSDCKLRFLLVLITHIRCMKLVYIFCFGDLYSLILVVFKIKVNTLLYKIPSLRHQAKSPGFIFK